MVRLAVVLGLALAATLGCASSSAPSAAKPPRGVAVPRVVGLQRSRAECRLHAAGLRWRVGAQRSAQGKPIVPCKRRNVHVLPDPVVKRQRPPAGRRVPRDTAVVLEDACTLQRFRAQPGACS